MINKQVYIVYVKHGMVCILTKFFFLISQFAPFILKLYVSVKDIIHVIIIIKLYCHIQRALHDELECSLALTHIVPIYIIK